MSSGRAVQDEIDGESRSRQDLRDDIADEVSCRGEAKPTSELMAVARK